MIYKYRSLSLSMQTEKKNSPMSNRRKPSSSASIATSSNTKSNNNNNETSKTTKPKKQNNTKSSTTTKKRTSKKKESNNESTSTAPTLTQEEAVEAREAFDVFDPSRSGLFVLLKNHTQHFFGHQNLFIFRSYFIFKFTNCITSIGIKC
jgi:hypothetical protein